MQPERGTTFELKDDFWSQFFCCDATTNKCFLFRSPFNLVEWSGIKWKFRCRLIGFSGLRAMGWLPDGYVTFWDPFTFLNGSSLCNKVGEVLSRSTWILSFITSSIPYSSRTALFAFWIILESECWFCVTANGESRSVAFHFDQWIYCLQLCLALIEDACERSYDALAIVLASWE